MKSYEEFSRDRKKWLVLLLPLFGFPLAFAGSGCEREPLIWEYDYSKASPEAKLVRRIYVKMKNGAILKVDEIKRGEWVEAPAYPDLEKIR